MDDAELRSLLRGAYQFLDVQSQMLDQLNAVTHSMHKTLREIVPGFEKVYEKHYAAEIEAIEHGALAVGRKALARLILQLSDS